MTVLNLLAVVVLFWMALVQDVGAKAAYLSAHKETHDRQRVIIDRLERIEAILEAIRREKPGS